MRSIKSLADLSRRDIFDIFTIADKIQNGEYKDYLKGKSIILFFPDSSIRTRVTFEKGIFLLGGQPILFPTTALDKKEKLEDVCGYLNNWADTIIVRHKSTSVIDELTHYSNIPIINGMTDLSHPCEIISDMYALSKVRNNFASDKYLFCGKAGNIGYSWKQASELMGFEISQCCGEGYEIEGMTAYHNIRDAIIGKDIVCTDSLPSNILDDFKNCQVTKDIMLMANEGAVLNPCPPFYRGEEVSADAINSEYFVGFQFKKYLLEVQQAIIIFCLSQH